MEKTTPAKSGGLRTKGKGKQYDINCPVVSIITVVYNLPDNLEKTLQSVIQQAYPNIEYIIIDGGSTDHETIEVIKKYEDHIDFWISEPDNGIYDAMNKGLKNVAGDYVSFLNAGDYYCNEYVLDSLFSDIKNEDVVYGDIYVDSGLQKPTRYQRALTFNKNELLAHGTAVVCHQALFVKRAIAPNYNTSYKYKAELNWYFDIVETKHNLSFAHKNIAVVNYALGGFGYINFKSNLLEWCKLIIMRYGLRTFFKYKYPNIIIQKLKSLTVKFWN